MTKKTNHSRLVLSCGMLALHLSLLVWRVPAIDSQPVSVRNTSRYVGRDVYGNYRWDWTVFIDASRSVMDSVSYVEYTLHPTFPNPVRRSYDRRACFSLNSNGWGEFDLRVKVVYKNGQATTLTYRLRLGDKNPTQLRCA